MCFWLPRFGDLDVQMIQMVDASMIDVILPVRVTAECPNKLSCVSVVYLYRNIGETGEEKES